MGVLCSSYIPDGWMKLREKTVKNIYMKEMH